MEAKGAESQIKSVHITNYYHEKSGGVKTNYDKLLQEANSHKRYVRLIVPSESDRIEDVGEYGRIYFVQAKNAPVFDKRYRLILPFHYLQADTPIHKILLDEKPDLIEIYDNYAITLLAGIIQKGYYKELKRPMLVYFTGERFDTIFTSFVLGGKLGRWFSRRLMGNYNLAMFDYFIANSPFVAEELYESFLEENNPRRSKWFFNFCQRFFSASDAPFKERVAICPRGVNTEHFSPSRRSKEVQAEMRRNANIPADSTVLLSATRLSLEKNIRLLPEIMKILANDKERDYRLLVAGAGPQSDWLNEETEKHFPGKLILLGHLDKETLANYYANTDVFIHPNPREPFGNVALEAMASGACVLAPNEGGILSYATDENAWLAEANAESFAKAVKEIVGDESLRLKKTSKAIETAQNNSTEKAIKLLFSTYDEMYEKFQRTRFSKG
ncbi:MAG: glycosyltransferase [Acidobacteria bacterium]|nr:glycosyltransferase [Acidobacteriota bacterium]